MNEHDQPARRTQADIEEQAYLGVIARLDPAMAAGISAREQARTMARHPDFLKPDWTVLSPITVMPLCQAVALACCINPRFAGVIEYLVGEGAALTAINDARGLLKYVTVKHGKTPETEVPLDSMAEWMRDVGRSLPAGYPGAPAPDTSNAQTNQEDRRLRQLETVHRGTAILRNGRWRFTGVKRLMEAEVARGAGRASDKSIREDLIAACERRKNAKRERDTKSSATEPGAVWAPLKQK